MKHLIPWDDDPNDPRITLWQLEATLRRFRDIGAPDEARMVLEIPTGTTYPMIVGEWPGEYAAGNRPPEPEQGLSDAEVACLDGLGRFINAFRALPVFHAADVAEAVAHVHALQNMVMARAAYRAHPDLFPKRP